MLVFQSMYCMQSQKSLHTESSRCKKNKTKNNHILSTLLFISLMAQNVIQLFVVTINLFFPPLGAFSVWALLS